MNLALHPESILFEANSLKPMLPVCEHYAGNPKFLKKAVEYRKESGLVFDITCDLEDGAPVGREDEHRKEMLEMFLSLDDSFGRIGVRLHDPEHPIFRKELNCVIETLGLKIGYLTIPKVKNASVVMEVEKEVQAVLAKHSLKQTIPLHILIETPQALNEVWSIAALQSVSVLDFGIMDFIAEHQGALDFRAVDSPLQFEHAVMQHVKSQIVLAAGAHRKIASHNVCRFIKEPERAYQDALTARTKFGFQRMWSVHPSQIEPIIKAMSPSSMQLEEAFKVLSLAKKASWGPVSYNGLLHDRASYRSLWMLLKTAYYQKQALPQGCVEEFFT